MPVVIEIVAKLGDTILEHVYVPPGRTYRFAGVDLAAKPGVLRTGLVDITMERTFHVENPLALPRPDIRPWFYILGSLALHATILAIALLAAPFERLRANDIPRQRFVHIEAPLPDPAPPKKTAKLPAAVAAMSTANEGPAPNVHARRGASDKRSVNEMLHEDAAAIVARVAASTPDVAKAMEGVGPLYNEDDANAKGFGGGRWDIDNDPEFDTVKTGPGLGLTSLDLSSTGAGFDIGATPEQKEQSKKEQRRQRIVNQTALAHVSAVRGDCVPAHRIAKWLAKLDASLYSSIYLADPVIVYCLAQPVPPTFVSQDERRTH